MNNYPQKRLHHRLKSAQNEPDISAPNTLLAAMCGASALFALVCVLVCIIRRN